MLNLDITLPLLHHTGNYFLVNLNFFVAAVIKLFLIHLEHWVSFVEQVNPVSDSVHSSIEQLMKMVWFPLL